MTERLRWGSNKERERSSNRQTDRQTDRRTAGGGGHKSPEQRLHAAVGLSVATGELSPAACCSHKESGAGVYCWSLTHAL